MSNDGWRWIGMLAAEGIMPFPESTPARARTDAPDHITTRTNVLRVFGVVAMVRDRAEESRIWCAGMVELVRAIRDER
ncbi:MAG: hypothetical protein U1F68_13335 [Gammaproteobacteria bacterium]